MRILAITAGAANMYCGSCLRDNALATELLRTGHDVTLVPIYTPTRTDEPNVSEERVLYGGVNVYLQQSLALFRRTPAFLDRLFDSSVVMKLVSRLSVSTDPAQLAELTLSTLRGENGNQSKEVRKLTSWLSQLPRPDVIVLPNSLMIGLAPSLRRELEVPIVCTLQGEDLFWDGLPSEHRSVALDLIRSHVASVDRFVAVSDYYAGYMGELLEIPDGRMRVVPLGINLDGYEPRDETENGSGPVRIGYFARVAPEKGLHNLCSAYRIMRERSGSELRATTLEVAGYMGREHRTYLAELRRDFERAGLGDEFHYHGVLDRAEKIEFLRSLDLVSVPTDYVEPKGIFLLEAMACGVPVVQPRKGAFPEMLERTGGGQLVEPGNTEALADALAELVRDGGTRRELGRRAVQGVREHYSVSTMAERALAVFREMLGQDDASGAGTAREEQQGAYAN